MRRTELERLGIQLPALPTVVLGALPDGAVWAERLGAMGLDVVCSGAAADTAETVAAAAAAVPYRPLKARAGDAHELFAAGCRLIESAGAVPEGAYRLSAADGVLPAVGAAHPGAEDFNEVARACVRAARALGAANLWVAAGPGLERLRREDVEAKLAALVEGAHQARLALAKDQFDLAGP